jgi:hypothetical protein
MASPAGVEEGTADAKSMQDALPSPLDSVGDMRSAAKWMLAAAGAVGAALISGGPLVAVGQVHGVLHAVLAGLGLVIALGGVGTAIWFTSKVLVPRLMTPAVLQNAGRPQAAPPRRSVLRRSVPRVRLPAILQPSRQRELVALKELVNAEPAEFFGIAAASVDGLFARQQGLRQNAASLARQAAREKDPRRRAMYQDQLRRVEANGERVGRYVRYLLALGLAWQIKADLELSRKWTLAGAVLVIVGAVLFFGSTGSNGPAYVPVVTTTPAATSSPAPAPTPASHH